MRRALALTAMICLLVQAAVVVSAQAVLWAGAAENWQACQCIHGEHAICPMHHKPAPGSKQCVWRSAGDHSDAVLASLVGVIGFAQQSTGMAAPPEVAVGRPSSSSPVLRSIPPDSPPPRLPIAR